MTAQPLLPRNAPFSPEDIDVLNSVVARTTPQQRSWLAGFFAGFEAAHGGAAQPQAVAAAKPRVPLTVLYASESGNAEALAMKTKKLAQRHGLDARVFDMADVGVEVLTKAQNLMVFASTWGEGDPPSRAVDFYEALMGDGAPRLDKSHALCRAGAGRYRVCAVLRHRQGDRCAPRGAGRDARGRPHRPRPRLRQAGGGVDRGRARQAGTRRCRCRGDRGARRFQGRRADRRRRRAAVHGGEPARSGDRRAHQSQRHRLDARDLARGDRGRRAGLLLSAGRRDRRRARERSRSRAGAGRGGGARRRRQRRQEAARELTT